MLKYQKVILLLGMLNLSSSYRYTIQADDAEMFTSEVHDPYARTTGAWK